MRTIDLFAAALAAALSVSVRAQASGAPCFETNLGTNLQLGDDAVAANNVLGFTFPGPGGAQVTSIDISSNGFVWLGSNTANGCCGGWLQDFLTNTARIAPMWSDLYPPGGNGVFFNTFPATPSSLARAVVTWDQIPEFGNTAPMTVQLQLFADGSMVFVYDANCSNLYHNVLVGVTEGTAAVANAVDFSGIGVTAPHISGTNPTIHEELSSTFDIAGKSFEFLPNGQGGYIVVDRPTCAFANVSSFGLGCPKPAVSYELFTATNPIDLSNATIDFLAAQGSGYAAVPSTGFFTGYTNAIATGDDVVTGPFQLPFSFAFPGGSTTAIDVSSNGFVWLSTGNWNSRCCYGDPATFVTDPASIAVLWQDLNPSQGGQIYFDVDPSNTAVHITWLNVPEYYNSGTNTCQLTLRSDGSFRMAWQGVANVSHDCLVGFSQGNGAIDPGSRDLSTSLPFVFGPGGTPLSLAPQTGSRPVIGTTFTMEIDRITAGSTLGAMVFGFNALVPGLDLSPLGMPGCEQNISLDASSFFPLLTTPATFPFAVPNSSGLVGYTLYAQAGTVTPGINLPGVAVSNGLAIQLGN